MISRNALSGESGSSEDMSGNGPARMAVMVGNAGVEDFVGVEDFFGDPFFGDPRMEDPWSISCDWGWVR